MQKPVIVISSHVARGSVGNRAAVFALEVLGHPVWALPTIVLPFHPGHGIGTRIVPENMQFAALLDDLANSPWIGEVGAVLTGYMANAEQAKSVGAFIKTIQTKSADLLYVCDPVMGDYLKSETEQSTGKLYIADETAEAIKSELCSIANVITPNRFELSWLSNNPIETTADAIKAAQLLGAQRVLVTSMPGFMKENIGNLLVENEEKSTATFSEHRLLKNPPNGPGDLTSALFLSNLLTAKDAPTALQKTTASVFEIIAGAAKRGADELMLETDAQSITKAMTMVQMRTISNPTSQGKNKIYKPSTL